MENTDNANLNKFINIIKGIFISVTITIVLFLIYGIILSSSNVSENTINPVIIVITVLSILVRLINFLY